MNTKDPRGPLRRLLEQQAAARTEEAIPDSVRAQIRSFVDATSRSFLVSFVDGKITHSPSTIGLQWRDGEQARTASVTAWTESRDDGAVDLVLRDCPAELRLLAMLSAQFSLPSFTTLREEVADSVVGLASADSGAIDPYGEPSRLAASDIDDAVFSLSASGGDEDEDDFPIDESDSIRTFQISWSRGEKPQFQLTAAPDEGPFFGVLDAKWEMPANRKQEQISGFVIGDYRGNHHWEGQARQIRPSDADKGSILVRPLESNELHLLPSADDGDELSPLTQFLAVQDFKAWVTNNEHDTVRISGLPQNLFDSSVDLVLRGISVAVPFDQREFTSAQQEFDCRWQQLESRITSQLVHRIRKDAILKMDMLDDIRQQIAISLFRNLQRLRDRYSTGGMDSVYGYVGLTTVRAANHEYGKRKRISQELSDQYFCESDEDSDRFLEQIKDPVDRIAERIERESKDQDLMCLREYMKYLTAQERQLVLDRIAGVSCRLLAAKFDVKVSAIQYRVTKAMNKLLTIHKIRTSLCDSIFGESVLSREEFHAVFCFRANIRYDGDLSRKEIDHAVGKLELVLAMLAIAQVPGLPQLSDSEVELIESWLAPESEVAESEPVEWVVRLGQRLHGQFLLHHYAAKEKRLQKTGETYIQYRIVRGCDWATTLKELKKCRACKPGASKHYVDPNCVPRKVFEKWDKVPSLVPLHCRKLEFEEIGIVDRTVEASIDR